MTIAGDPMSKLPRARVVRGTGGEGKPGGGEGKPPPRGLVLRLAPRKLPAVLRRRVLLGSPIAGFGWLFAAAGMVMAYATLPRVGLAPGDAAAGAAQPVSAWGAVVVLLFPIAGLAIALSQLRGALRDLRLLERGEQTTGKLVDKRETSVTYNDVPVMALTFEYRAGGRTYQTTVKTLTPAALEDDEREAMLYDPQDPTRATTLDHLPGSPVLSPGGELEAPPGISFHLLIMPAIFICLVIATVRELI